MRNPEHDLEWNDRLQDWLDGDIEAGEQTLIESHLRECDTCQQHLLEFETLDTALSSAAPPIALDDTFDARVLAQIDATSDARRVQARQRVQAEVQAELRELSRNWRRTLGTILPGVLAGIAIALSMAIYFDTAEWVRAFAAQSAGEIEGLNATFIHLFLTSSVGAAIGYTVARWLTPAAD